MKRSEMVEKIEQFVYDATLGEKEISPREADEILNSLEKAGMLPPSVVSVLTNVEGRKIGEQFTCFWEPEED